MLATAIILALSTLTSAPSFVSHGLPHDTVPQIAEVQRRAIDHARLDPAEISSWKRRAKLSALLPRFQLDYGMRLKNEVNVNVNESVYVGSSGTTVGPNAGGVESNQNSDQNIGVRAVWNFNEAIFNPDSLAVSEETRLLARERHAILAEVNKNYYERDRAVGEMAFLRESLKREARPEKIRREIFMQQVVYDEATAALDALTGGWFSKRVEEAR